MLESSLACMQVGDSDAAFNRFREMSGMGLRPNQGTYGSLLHCCAQIGNHKSAARVMQMMRSAGIRPSVEAYTSLMNACVKACTPASLAQAFQVRLMSAADIPSMCTPENNPNTSVYFTVEVRAHLISTRCTLWGHVLVCSPEYLSTCTVVFIPQGDLAPCACALRCRPTLIMGYLCTGIC